jgi:hypothetical protein
MNGGKQGDKLFVRGLVKWTWVCKRVSRKVLLRFFEMERRIKRITYELERLRYTPVRTVLMVAETVSAGRVNLLRL